MLSPQLLTILRIYWRLAKPAHWLFPGRDAGRPVSTATLQAACRVAVRAAGLASRSPSTPCATASPPICSRRAPTFASSRSCSATAGWRPPRSTPASPRASSPARPARSTVCPARGGAAGLSARMRSALEVADVFRRHGAAYRQAHAGHLSQRQRRVMAAIEACRTAALGGHVEHATDCGQVRIAYNSCRNRHCPKCQGLARAEWLADRQAELLPVPYFHVVFTVPAPIAEIAFQNKTVVYDILFKAAPRRCASSPPIPSISAPRSGWSPCSTPGGRTCTIIRIFHCVVPGGGPSPDGTRWIGCRPGFFLPVKVLARLYRRLFLTALQAAFDRRRLQFHADLAELGCARGLRRAACGRRRVDPWVVFAKRPFGGPEQVLAYLGRYTHRVAITNSRLVGLTKLASASVEGLSPPRQAQGDDARCRRVHPPLPAPRPARRLPPHPSLRLPRQWPACRQAGPCRRLLAVHRRTPSPAMAGDYRERYHQSDRPLARPLSRVRWPHGRAQSTGATPERQLMTAALRPTLEVVIPSPATASVAWRSRRRRMTAPEAPASWHPAAVPARQPCRHGRHHAATSARPTPPQKSPRLAPAPAGTTTAAQRP